MCIRDRIVGDGVFAIVEALVVLVFSPIPLALQSISYALHTKGVNFIDAFFISLESTIRPTEMIVYITAILSSITAYFFLRIPILKSHLWPTRIFFAIICIIILLATPLFISGLETDPENQELAATFGNFLLIFALFTWLLLLFNQRRVYEKPLSLSRDNRADEIAKNVEKTHNGTL